MSATTRKEREQREAREDRTGRAEYILARAEELPPGRHRVFAVAGREIGVFNVAGTYHALPNLCPHQIGPLCQGRVSGTLACRAETGWQLEWVHDGEIITCPWHGMEFHIPTGQSLAFKEIRLRRYKVWEEDGLIKLRL
ncbi:MAG: Rieske 2Fe-2S domain-containing protein [Caldilineaceae bacterium]|nr:Rieske 2Fe-2S domain-containing protein [Caldilineaceae bacterium]